MKTKNDFHGKVLMYFHDMRIVADLANEAKEFMTIPEIFTTISYYIGVPEVKSFMKEKYVIKADYLDRGDNNLTTVFYFREDKGFLAMSVNEFLKDNTIWLCDVNDLSAGIQKEEEAEEKKSKLNSIFKRLGLDLSDDLKLNLAHAHSLIKYAEMSKEDIDLINEYFE